MKQNILAWQLLASSYEISYLRKLLADISPTPIDDLEPTLLYGDNMGAIAALMVIKHPGLVISIFAIILHGKL
jgi:hypothetical protein